MGPRNTMSLPKFPGDGALTFGQNIAAVVSKTNNYLLRRGPRLDSKSQNMFKGLSASTRRRHRAENRAKLLGLPKTLSSRNGHPAMPSQLLYKWVTQGTFLQRLPPVAVDPPMEMSPTRGLGPPHRAPSASTICDSCLQPIRLGIRPTHVPMPTVHALSTLQGYAVSSPPTREGGCAGSTTNQTADRKQWLIGRSPTYSSKS